MTTSSNQNDFPSFAIAAFIGAPIFPGNNFSPLNFIFFPLLKCKIPKSTLIIIGLDLFATLLAKWTTSNSAGYYNAFGQLNQSFLDYKSVNKAFTLGNNNKRNNNPSRSQDTAIFPKGFELAVSLSAPFSSTNSRPDTTFNIQLFEIKGIPGYVIVIMSILINILGYKYYQQKSTSNSSSNSNNATTN